MQNGFIDIAQAVEAISALDCNIAPVITPRDGDRLERLVPLGGSIVTDCAATVEKAQAIDMPASHIFFSAASYPASTLSAMQGQCRFLVERLDTLSALDDTLEGTLPPGYLEPVGICLAVGADITSVIRRTRNLTLRSVFVALCDNEPAKAAREAFSFIKQLRSDVPCMLHSFCFQGLLQPLVDGDTALAETLKMLSALNDSSLYADFFIA